MTDRDTPLARWLAYHGLADHLDAFGREAIDIDVLGDLTDDDLRDLGLPLGDRKRFRRAIDSTPPTSGSSEVQQRNLTVVFCDLVDSTALATTMDREDFAVLVREFTDAGRRAILAHGGMVAKYTGDGFMAVFGYPSGSDDDAARAVRAGLAIQEVVSAIDARFDVTVAARIGVASGMALVGRVLGKNEVSDVIGDTPALAARVEAKAPVGGVAVADVTRRLAGDGFEYQDLGLFDLKGFAEPVRLHRVLASRPDPVSFTAPTALVARTAELDLLRGFRGRVLVDGARLVRVLGEAGTGKSRLVDAFGADTMAAGWVAVRLGCVDHEHSVHAHPLRRAMASAAGLRMGDPAEVRDRKLHELAARLGVKDPDAVVSLLTGDEPTGVSPADHRQALHDTLTELATRVAASTPLLVVVEDIHWADATTASIVTEVLAAAGDRPLLVVATARPTMLADAPTIEPIGVPVDDLDLEAFDDVAATALVHHLAPDLGDAVVDAIVARADGVPLFLEELTRAVAEAGVDADAPAGVDIPLTLHETLTARLDRLPVGRDLAPVAAALGRSFSFSLLHEVAPDHDVDRGIAELLEARIIQRSGTGAEFRHSLLRDLAYEAMVREDRRAVHDRAATALVQVFSTMAESTPHLVAHHFSRGTDPVRAVPWWARSAVRAARHSANAEVVHAADAALEVIARTDGTSELRRTELELQLLRAGALRGTAGFAAPITGAAYRRARDLCEHGDTDQQFTALNGVYSFHLVHDEYDLAGEAADDILQLADASGEPKHGVVGHRATGAVAFHVGRLADAETHLARSVELYLAGDYGADRFVYGTDHASTASCFLALAQWIRGRPALARQTSDWAIAHATALDHDHSWAQTLTYRCFLDVMGRDWDAVGDNAEALAEKSAPAGLTLMEITARFWRATSAFFQGDAAALDAMHEASQAWWSTGARSYFPFRNTLLAEAHAECGDPERGLELLTEALDRIAVTDERWAEAETHRVRGVLLAGQGHLDEARDALGIAITVAESQDAQLWALRAELTMATLGLADVDLRATVTTRRDRIAGDVIDLETADTFLST